MGLPPETPPTPMLYELPMRKTNISGISAPTAESMSAILPIMPFALLPAAAAGALAFTFACFCLCSRGAGCAVAAGAQTRIAAVAAGAASAPPAAGTELSKRAGISQTGALRFEPQ